jgi:RNA polymerase sigma factor (sigma-70 family)
VEDVKPRAFIPDRAIVEGIRGGREEAQKQLWDKYWPWLVFTARRTGLSEEDAEEVVSDVFFRMLQRIAAGVTGYNLGPLLRVATRNAAISHHREGRARREHEAPAPEPDPEDPEASGPQCEGFSESSEVVGYRILIVRQALDRLSPKDQQVLNAIACDATNEELAEWLDTNENNARQLRSRAKSRLKQAILDVLDGLPETDHHQAREKIFGRGA